MLSYLPAIGPIILTVMGAILATRLLDPRQKSRWRLAFIVIDFITAFGTIYSAYYQRDALERISTLASESLNQLTSADSFCHIEATGNPDNSILLTLFHNGKYPLFDVVVEVQDTAAARRFWQEFKRSGQTQLGSADIRAARGVVVTQNISTLNVHAALPLISVLADNPSDRRTFTIRMTARNGFYTETINIIKQNKEGRWLVDEHLFKQGAPNNEPIWEHISPEFP